MIKKLPNGRRLNRTTQNYPKRLALVNHWVSNRYNRLLTMLFIVLVGRPLWSQLFTVGLILQSLTILILIFILIQSSLFNRHGRWLFLILAGLAFITQTLEYFVPDDFIPEVITIADDFLAVRTVGIVINAVFVGISSYLIAQELFLQHRASADMIKGGICAYIMIGICWSLLYQAIYLWNPAAYQLNCESCEIDLLYFSFTTLTTLGYGDIVPTTVWVRSLANLEVVVGMLYPTIFIARLVSLYSHEEDVGEP